MSSLCCYATINDKWAPRVFMERQIINEYLEFYGKINDKWGLRVFMER
jgi:hypothetical protein